MLSNEAQSLDEPVFPIDTLTHVDELSEKVWTASLAQAKDSQVYANGLLRYSHDFIDAFVISLSYFMNVESRRILEYPPAQTIMDYTTLLLLNQQLALKALKSSISTIGQYYIPR